MAMLWYAVQTLSGQEDKAMTSLQKRIEMYGLSARFGVLLVPSETVVDPKTKRSQKRRFYPGYMLVQMVLDNETLHLVKETPSIMGFLGNATNPPPVPEADVARITNLIAGEEQPRPVLDFEVGEEVRLIEGSYAAMPGVVEEIHANRGRLKVSINIFGRPVSTELGFHQVEKLS